MRFRPPETVLGCFLTIAVFAMGMMFQSSLSPPKQNSATHESADEQPNKKINDNDNKIQSLWEPTDSVGLYTLVLAVFTGVLAGVSIFQGVMLLRADKTARISAEATLEQGRTFKDIQRAQLNIDGFETVIDHTPNNAAVVAFRIAAKWKNNGQTTALAVGVEMAWRFNPPDRELVFDFPAPPIRSGQVGAGGGVKTGYAIIPIAVAARAWRKELRIFIYTSAVYNDIFDSSRDQTIGQCEEILFDADPTVVMRADDRNTWMHIGGYNGPYRLNRQYT